MKYEIDEELIRKVRLKENGSNIHEVNHTIGVYINSIYVINNNPDINKVNRNKEIYAIYLERLQKLAYP